MGMAYAYKKGELDTKGITNLDEIKKIADSMSMKELKKFAKTKEEKLPHWKTNESLTFKQYLMLEGNVILDTDSAEDSARIMDFLDDEDIRYTKMGPKLTLALDRDSLKASTILSHLNRMGVRFQDISR